MKNAALNGQPTTARSPLADTTAYREDSALSRSLYERALRVMPGGNSRHAIALAPYPIYVASGRGCRVIDVEGQERIDFLNNFTSLILGHADPRVTDAVHKQIDRGTAFTMPCEADIELAELLIERIGYIDQLRFCNSGTEAVMLAVKAARAATGRMKIAKFEGCYHGAYDYAQVSDAPPIERCGAPNRPASVLEAGTASAVADDVIVMPWNDLRVCRELISENSSQLAAVLVDPLPAALGLIAPEPGFLEMLREETSRHGVLLIADEVMSFRLAYDGALAAEGIEPDLTALAKIIGGGYAVGAVAGTREVMSIFDHTLDMRVHHSGTFNGNPVTMVAGLETMRQITRETYERLDRLGDYVREALVKMLTDRRITAQAFGRGSLFSVHLTGETLRDYRSLVEHSRDANRVAVHARLCHEMLGRGIMISKRGIFGCLSTPMTEAELDAFVAALDESLAAIGYRD